MNLVLLTKAMCLSGKIRYKMSSRSGGYYSSIQRNSRQTAYSRTHFNFILFCFAFVTTNDMREDLFWEWVRQAHCFTPEQRDGILALRRRENESSRSVEFLATLSCSLYLRNTILNALERHGANNIGQFLNHTLEWARTSQGHEFWLNLNRRFDHCWTCISRALLRPIRSDIGFDEFRSAIRTNISAGLLRPDELTNTFFLSYEEDLRRYDERQLRREQELDHQWDIEVGNIVARMAQSPGDRNPEERVETEGHPDESGDNGQDGIVYTGQNGEVHFITREEYERMRSATDVNRSRPTPTYDTMSDGSIIVRFSDGSAMRYTPNEQPTAAPEVTAQPATGDGLMGQIGMQGTTAANTATSVPGRESTTGQASRQFYFSFEDLRWNGSGGTNNH